MALPHRLSWWHYFSWFRLISRHFCDRAFGNDPPSVLKYGMVDYPDMPLYNSFGLPTPPFVSSVEVAA